jgi:hypothetical protein
VSGFGGEIHPLADQWPMLPDDELAALGEDIATHGQLEDITLDAQGRLVDGRNRLAACNLADIGPRFYLNSDLDTDEKIAAFINSKNAQHRDNKTGQKAMSNAVQLAAEGKRQDGRWKRGSITQKSGLSPDAWTEAMRVAGIVIDHAPELAVAVKLKEITLNDAATKAEVIRDKKRREADAEEERAKNLAIVREKRPDIAAKVDAGDLSTDDAIAIIHKEIAAQKKAEADRKSWVKKLATLLTESVANAQQVAHPDNLPELIAGWKQHPDIRPPLSKNLTAKEIRSAADHLNAIADEWTGK